MDGNWAFAWVQIIAHNWKPLGWRFALATLLGMGGLWWLPASIMEESLPWLLAAVGVMAILMRFLFDSVRTALLHLGLSLGILLLTFGLAGWWHPQLDTRATLLGGVVVLTIMTSNLVHVLGAILREMARGQFQHDAVAEGLKHNAAPIVLANFTTVLGFAVSAWASPELAPMAVVVALGAAASLWATLTWLPWLLIKWFLEFRVGHYADRHGYSRLVRFFIRRPGLRRMTVALGALLLLGSTLWLLRAQPQALKGVLTLLAVVTVLLWISWRSLKMALINVALNWFAVAVAVALWLAYAGEVSVLALLAPLGLVVDDGIHFFTRYVRAMRIRLFDTAELRVRFALGSVGRTIWLTSVLLMAGLSVLLLHDDTLIRQAVLITDMALIMATFLVVAWYPALLIAAAHRRAQAR